MIKKIKKLFGSNDARVLLENFISLSSLQLISMFLPLVTLPYVLRVLGFEKYGVIVLATSLIAYFTSLTDYSFKITATRDIAIFRHSPKKVNLIYSKVLLVKSIFLLMSFTFITLVTLFYLPFYEERFIIFLTSFMLLGYSIFPEWFFQGIEKMKYITILNVGVKIFFTACVFLFIKNEQDYWIYPFLQSSGFVVAGFIGQYILIKKYNVKLILLKPKRIINAISSNFPIFINQFFPTLYNNTSTFLLGILTTPGIVGVYDAIKKIVDLAITLIGILSRVFFPYLNRKRGSFNSYKTLMLCTGSILSVLCMVSYQFIFWYLNINDANAFSVLFTLAIGIVGFTVYDVFGINYFIIRRQDNLVMKNTIIVSIIGLILAFPLIQFWGILGAAINLSLARVLMGLGLGVKYFQQNKKEII